MRCTAQKWILMLSKMYSTAPGSSCLDESARRRFNKCRFQCNRIAKHATTAGKAKWQTFNGIPRKSRTSWWLLWPFRSKVIRHAVTKNIFVTTFRKRWRRTAQGNWSWTPNTSSNSNKASTSRYKGQKVRGKVVKVLMMNKKPKLA